MRVDQSLLDAEYLRLQQLTDEVLQNPEVFRRDAKRALKLYIPRERAVTEQLLSYLSVTTFFEKWQSDLQVRRQTLRANENNKSFLNALDKYLLLDHNNAAHVSHALISTRDTELVEKFLESLNIPDTRKGRDVHQTLVRLLSWSDQHLLTYKEHYVAATLYKATSAQHATSFVDPHASFFAKKRAARRVRRERKAALQSERLQLRKIAKDIETVLQKPLITDVLRSRLEVIQFLTARASYDKKLAALPEAESKQISIRSTLMMRETTTLRRAFHSAQDDLTTETLPAYDQFFDALLRNIFNLSTVQKNMLMADMKHYRELVSAQQAILNTQAARLAVQNEF
jgi:hypothetical protein